MSFRKTSTAWKGKSRKRTEAPGRSCRTTSTSFFKAFLVKHQDAYHTIAFICPNNPDSVTIVGTAQSVNTVETFTGYDLFGFLDDGVEEDVEDEVDAAFWTK